MKGFAVRCLVLVCMVIALSSSGWAAERPIRILYLDAYRDPQRTTVTDIFLDYSLP